MITTRKTFYEITQEYKISSMEEVQRNYTWGSLEVFNFEEMIKSNSQSNSDCLKDIGPIYATKLNNNDSYHLQNFDSISRLTNCSLNVIAVKNIIDSSSDSNNIFQKINTFQLNRCYQKLIEKGTFVLLEDDDIIFRKIINNEALTEQEQKTTVYKAYITCKNYLSSYFKEKPEIFISIVNYLVSDLSFIFVIYESSPIDDIRKKYGYINMLKKEHTDLHKTITALKNIANDCSKIFDFENNYNNYMLETKKIKKNGQKLPSESADSWMYSYINSKLLQLGGYGKKQKSNYKAVDLINKNLLPNKQLSEYIIENIFSDYSIYEKSKLQTIEYDIPANSSNIDSSAWFLFLQSEMNKKPRAPFVASYFKLLSYYKIIDNKIVGYKYNTIKNEMVDSFMRELGKFLLYNRTKCCVDTRNNLNMLLKTSKIYFDDSDHDYDGKTYSEKEEIKMKKELAEYVESLKKENEAMFDSDIFKTNMFSSFIKPEATTEFMYCVLSAYNKSIEKLNDNEVVFNTNNFWINLSQEIRDFKKFSDKDHIYFNHSCNKEFIKDDLKNCIGNMRLLNKVDNRAQNNPEQLRIIPLNDYTFSPNVRGKQFTSEHIIENRDYRVSLIKSLPVFN